MGWGSICKLLQKQMHDILSQRYGLLITLLCGFLLLFSAFQFGEVMLEWSTEKYAAVFNSFSDNIAGRSYRNRLCLPVPIDVVYTWVNGSDSKLLAELNQYKRLVGNSFNKSSPSTGSCDFANCVPAYAVIISPALPQNLGFNIVSTLYTSLKASTRQMRVASTVEGTGNVTAVFFSSYEEVATALNETIVVAGQNVSIMQAYYTSDATLPNVVLLKDTVLISGLPSATTEEKILSSLPASYKQSVTKVGIHTEQGVAVLLLSDIPGSNKSTSASLVGEKNITMDGKELVLSSACLLWDTHDYSRNTDVSASRYEDNEELKYSLRSVEKFAPWVRHVFLVTNGQLPSWLNMDNPRLTIVTHKELFPNQSHLPTFASPAIEAHLHRIPGLSDKFIYLNDDVMFGKEVWPDDFYTHSRGQKVYLTWPVPNCQDGCPSTWIRDGYCDKACNNSECEWDGGDCEGGRPAVGVGGGGIDSWAHNLAGADLNCNAGCANSWIADKYCDTACNVRECGFDAGDCGVDRYTLLHEIDVALDDTHIRLPPGETAAYLNMTTALGPDGKISEGSFEDTDIVRAIAVAQKFQIVTIVLASNRSTADINITVIGHTGHNTTIQYNCTITADTRPVPTKLSPVNNNSSHVNDTEMDKEFQFQDILPEQKAAEASDLQVPDLHSIPNINMSLYEIPVDLEGLWQQLQASYKEGELTERGFQLELYALWYAYVELLAAEGKKPQLKGQHEDSILQDNKGFEEDEDEHVGEGVRAQLPQADLKAESKQVPQADLKAESKQVPQADLKAESKQVPQLKPIEDPVLLQKQDAMLGEGVVPVNRSALSDGPHHQSRRLSSVREGEETLGLLPWEKDHSLDWLQKKFDAEMKMSEFVEPSYTGRRLLDTFGDSLRHVNRLYNKQYGYLARKVPAHMPHMIDRNIMTELQQRFPDEWDATSSHRIRSSTDMQFAFAYFYFLMSEPQETSYSEVFDEMDMDHSGILSDREIRTMATRLFELPLDLATLTGLESKLINCSKHQSQDPFLSLMTHERYYDKDMPQVTKSLILNCQPVMDLIRSSYKGRTKYRYETVGEEELAFKMIQTNVSQVVGQLDDIRRHPKKFICLNDNIDHGKEDAKTVKAVIQDFYESLFPLVSSFELSREYRNRFLHVDELREWRRYRDWLKWWTQLALSLLVLFTLASFLSEKLEGWYRRSFPRRPRRDSPGGLVVRLPLETV